MLPVYIAQKNDESKKRLYAKCGNCGQVQHSTSTSRLEWHYKKCVLGENPPPERSRSKKQKTDRDLKPNKDEDNGELWEEIEKQGTDKEKAKRTSGAGRPRSEAWDLYNISPVYSQKNDGSRKRLFAKCNKCGSVIQSTAANKLEMHYRRCVLGEKVSSVSASQKQHSQETILLKRPKIEPEFESEEDHEDLWGDYGADYDDGSDSHSQKPSIKIVDHDILRQGHPSTSTDSALSKFLIGCNVPFDVIDSVHFKNFARTLNPNYEPPTSKQLKNRVLDLV